MQNEPMNDEPAFALLKHPEYQPLWQALEPILASGTRRIHLWDANHNNPEPREIFADAELLAMASKYGRPLYISEALSAGNMVERYQNGTVDDRRAIHDYFFGMAANRVTDDQKQMAWAAANIDILTLGQKDMADIYGPDPRIDKPFPKLTDTEQEVAKKFAARMKEDGGIDFLTEENLTLFVRSLSRKERNAFIRFEKKFAEFAAPGSQSGILDTSQTDAEISRRIEAYGAQSTNASTDRVQIMLYGAGHYTKPHDLDDTMPGVSIMVMDSPGGLEKLNKMGLLKIDDKPEFVWYANENRLVKLDNPAAIQEMLGVPSAPIASSPSQEKTGHGLTPSVPPISPIAAQR